MLLHAADAASAATQWLLIARERLLSPKRSADHLARCDKTERERYQSAIRKKSEERLHAKIDCERRIDALRAEVFAAQDGVVTGRMTALEREWRQVSKAAERDRDGALMDLWARIAPPAWMDRKLWRDTAPASQLDAAIALTSDVAGVTDAEAAIHRLLPKARIRWRLSDEQDFEHTGELLLKTASTDDRIDHRVYEAALARFPRREILAHAIAHAAVANNESAHVLRDLWTTGYVISSVSDIEREHNVVTLEIPPLR